MADLQTILPNWIENAQYSTILKEMFSRINRWNEDYSPNLEDNGQPIALTPEDFLSLKLFVCWCHHWQTAGSGYQANEVADHVEKGQGFSGNGYLGGNPFFDLFLASSLCRMSSQAHDIFLMNYGNFLCKISSKFSSKQYISCSKSNLPDWWGQFFCYLTESTSDKVAPLNSFSGYSGLKNWLKMTISLFLMSLKRKKKELNFSEMDQSSNQNENENDLEANIIEPVKAPSLPDSVWQEIKKKFYEALDRAKSKLAPEEWTRIRLAYTQKLKNKQIAVIYNETDATTTRKRVKAEYNLAQKLQVEIDNIPLLSEYKDDLLTWFSTDIAACLFRYIADHPDQEAGER